MGLSNLIKIYINNNISDEIAIEIGSAITQINEDVIAARTRNPHQRYQPADDSPSRLFHSCNSCARPHSIYPSFKL